MDFDELDQGARAFLFFIAIEHPEAYNQYIEDLKAIGQRPQMIARWTHFYRQWVLEKQETQPWK